MKFIDLAKERYSVRSYLPRKIEDEKLQLILEAGRVAPTACNNQPQRILVLQSDESLAKIRKTAPSKMFSAPCVIVVCADRNEAWVRPTDGMNSAAIDASIVTDHMMLQAQELGIGSVWICYFDAEMIKKDFNLPEGVEPINILALGYTDEIPQSSERHAARRKKLNETVFFESFS